MAETRPSVHVYCRLCQRVQLKMRLTASHGYKCWEAQCFFRLLCSSVKKVIISWANQRCIAAPHVHQVFRRRRWKRFCLLRHMLPSVCMSSVTLVHSAKAVRRNKMPFGRDSLVVPVNIVLGRGGGDPRSPYGKGRFGVRTPSLYGFHLLPNCLGICLRIYPRYLANLCNFDILLKDINRKTPRGLPYMAFIRYVVIWSLILQSIGKLDFSLAAFPCTVFLFPF